MRLLSVNSARVAQIHHPRKPLSSDQVFREIKATWMKEHGNSMDAFIGSIAEFLGYYGEMKVAFDRGERNISQLDVSECEKIAKFCIQQAIKTEQPFTTGKIFNKLKSFYESERGEYFQLNSNFLARFFRGDKIYNDFVRADRITSTVSQLLKEVRTSLEQASPIAARPSFLENHHLVQV